MPLAYPDYESIRDMYTVGIEAMFGLISKSVSGKKAKLTENLLEAIVHLTWRELGGEASRLSIGRRHVTVPIDADYVRNLMPESTRNHVQQDVGQYIYKLELDKGVRIDDWLVLAVECKAYMDNTMIRRTLKDFELASMADPKLIFCVFQLENGLTGDYGDPNKLEYLGSKLTHTLLSYSPEVRLGIITLLDGNRSSSKPIHNRKFFKQLPIENVAVCVSKFRAILEDFV